jgi:hypothetical protein
MRLNIGGGERLADMAQVALRLVPVNPFDMVKRDKPSCAGAAVAHGYCFPAVWYCLIGSCHLILPVFPGVRTFIGATQRVVDEVSLLITKPLCKVFSKLFR